MEVRGEKQTFSFLVIYSLFLFFFLFSLYLFQRAFSLGSGGGAWCPKVPAKLGMFCCEEPPHCDTLHTDLSFTADLKAREKKRKDLTTVNWALMCLAHSVKNKSHSGDNMSIKKLLCNLFIYFISLVQISTCDGTIYSYAMRNITKCLSIIIIINHIVIN